MNNKYVVRVVLVVVIVVVIAVAVFASPANSPKATSQINPTPAPIGISSCIIPGAIDDEISACLIPAISRHINGAIAGISCEIIGSEGKAIENQIPISETLEC